MECPEVQNRLSAYFDGELEEDQRLVIAAHLERCSACAEELQVFGRLSELTVAVRDLHRPPDQWNALQARLERGDRSVAVGPVETTGVPDPHPRRVMVLAATVLLAVIAGALAYHGWFGNGHHPAADLERFAKEFVEDPDRAQQYLLAKYDGQPLELREIARRLDYEPVVALSVPPGWSLKEVYLLHMPCCTCAQAILECEDGRRVAVFEHERNQAMWFGTRRSIDCVCDGKPTSVMDLGRQLVGSWQHGDRTITVIGARDLMDITRFVAHFSRSAEG